MAFVDRDHDGTAVTTQVIIPFRPDSIERADALVYVCRFWSEANATVVIARDDPKGPWCKAKAVHAAMSDAEIVIVADADCWVDPTALMRCREGLNQWHDWALPHHRVIRLGAEYTHRLVDSDEPPVLDDATLEEHPYTALRAAGGVVMFKREVWNLVPMDPRFLGWGFEDVAWWYAMHTLIGPAWRGKADLFHLWHPRDVPMDRDERSKSADPASRELLERYKAALRKPVAMQAIVDEAKAALSSWR